MLLVIVGLVFAPPVLTAYNQVSRADAANLESDFLRAAEYDFLFENFIKETLEYLKVKVPQGQRQQIDELLKILQAQKVLEIIQ